MAVIKVQQKDGSYVYITPGNSGTGGTGEAGKSLEFSWKGTQLGVRQEGQTNYQYVDLKGEKGETGQRGEQGIQGVKGADGVKGDKGEPGVAGRDGLTTAISVNGQTYNQVGGTITLPNYPQVPSNSDTLVTTPIQNNILTLTAAKYQTTTIANGAEIKLPDVTDFGEIHLFFSTTQDLTLTLPSCKWQNGEAPAISANATYEFIFTRVNTQWLAGYIVYE